MRYILPSLVLVILLFPSLASGETVNRVNLVDRNGVYYKKFTDVPFSGKVTGGQQGKIKNGKKEGPWVNYYPNGQLSFKGTFKNGWIEGPYVRYLEHGQVWIKGNYKDGEKDGIWVYYNENGQFSSQRTYSNGKRVK